jgi:hypothetical protein
MKCVVVVAAAVERNTEQDSRRPSLAPFVTLQLPELTRRLRLNVSPYNFNFFFLFRFPFYFYIKI